MLNLYCRQHSGLEFVDELIDESDSPRVAPNMIITTKQTKTNSFNSQKLLRKYVMTKLRNRISSFALHHTNKNSLQHCLNQDPVLIEGEAHILHIKPRRFALGAGHGCLDLKNIYNHNEDQDQEEEKIEVIIVSDSSNSQAQSQSQ